MRSRLSRVDTGGSRTMRTLCKSHHVAISVNRVFIAHKGKVLKELRPVFKKEENL